MQPPPLIESRVGVVVKALNFPGGGLLYGTDEDAHQKF